MDPVEERTLTPEDLSELRTRGIAAEEAERQLDLLRRGARPVELERPCRVGDGIVRLDAKSVSRLGKLYDAERLKGRAMKFVPASGAATRMFLSLKALSGAPIEWSALKRRASDGDARAQEAAATLAGLPRFAFYPELRDALAAEGLDLDGLVRRRRFDEAVRRLLGEPGLGLEREPKALIPFHRYHNASRTAIEEHLIEAAGYLAGRSGVARVHFTAAQENLPELLERLETSRPRLEAASGARFDVAFSIQKPSSDTLAMDAEGRPFRAGGRLLLRPGGHGALLENLGELGADIVFIRNIDNVPHERLQPELIKWNRALGGLLVELQSEAFACLEALERGGGLERAEALAAERLSCPVPKGPPQERRRRLRERLDRPIRVCGVVPNEGQPGGGPFWVRREGGPPTLQIVESAQVSEGSREVFAASTHFNPVHLACGLRDRTGKPYDLRRFADESAVFISSKSHEGRALKALERPGLWNGAMAGWNTVFVELPAALFNPVKVLSDLLRPGHQGV